MDLLALMDPFEVPVAPVWADPILVDVDPLRHHEMPLDLSISLDDLPDLPEPPELLELPEPPEPRASPPTVPASPKDALALPLRKHLSWTDDELRQLERLVRKHGRKWRKLADLLPGRTDDAVRQVYWRQRERPPRHRTVEERVDVVRVERRVPPVLRMSERRDARQRLLFNHTLPPAPFLWRRDVGARL